MAQKNMGLRLNVEVGTPLQIEFQGLGVKIKTRLIGMETWEYLIIKAPTGVAGIRNMMVEGNKLIVRYVSEGSVFGFEAYILTVINKPASLLIIDYPRKVAEKSLRKAERKDCYITCMVEVGGNRSEGALVDVSTLGCRCIAPHIVTPDLNAPDIGSSIAISFNSPLDESQIVLEGQIVNTAEYHTAARLGVKFTESVTDKIPQIEKLLDSLD